MYSNFTRTDLCSGDVVYSTKGSYGIVLLRTPVGSLIKWFKNRSGEIIHKYRMMYDINEDLSFKDESGRITKVYRSHDPHYYTTLDIIKDENLIWEDNTKEMTMAQIEAALGHKVKVVK